MRGGGIKRGSKGFHLASLCRSEASRGDRIRQGEMTGRVGKGMKLMHRARGSARKERGGVEIGRHNPKKKTYF
jgi:hypothetical protein